MSKRVHCKFFAHGGCLKGAHCGFLHDEGVPPKNVCIHFQNGSCSFGSRCKYQHIKVSESHSSTPSSSKNPLHSLVSDPVPSVAASTARTSDTPLISSSNSSFNQTPIDNETEEHLLNVEEKQKQIEALKLSEDIECSVCLERVLSKSNPSERKFGLLSECDHPFCISCIRSWRSSSPTPEMIDNSALRTCPVCRKHSNFVIPSSTWFSTPTEKQGIVERYKVALSCIDCKHFDSGNGRCPFGPSCFYKHTVKPGSYVWHYQRLPPRRRSGHRSGEGGLSSDGMWFDVDDEVMASMVDMVSSMLGTEDDSDDEFLAAQNLREHDILGLEDEDEHPSVSEIALLLAQISVHFGAHYSSTD